MLSVVAVAVVKPSSRAFICVRLIDSVDWCVVGSESDSTRYGGITASLAVGIAGAKSRRLIRQRPATPVGFECDGV